MRTTSADPGFFSVDLELTNQCENRCALCPRGSLRRKVGRIEPEAFSRLSDLLLPQGGLLSFSGMGDPLSHPGVYDFCREHRGKGGAVAIVVHPASLRDANACRLLVEARPNTVTVSFPSARPEIFERLCPSISFEEALSIARGLIRRARGRVGVQIAGIRTLINRDETETYLAFWRAEGARAEMHDCHGRGGNLPASELYPGAPPARDGRPCSLIAFHSFITWEGDILACCHDLTGETRLGNSLRDGLGEAARRKASLAGRPMPFELCLRCDEPLRSCRIPGPPGPGAPTSRRRFFKQLRSRASADAAPRRKEP